MPDTGRFLTRDTWKGNANQPLSFNRWNYGYGNPVNLIDPAGTYPTCAAGSGSSLVPTYCQTELAWTHAFAGAIKSLVTSGSLQPVEGFATFADLIKPHFNNNITDLVWAMTIVLNNFDANRGAIWWQAPAPFVSIGQAGSPYFMGEDWLPYQNNPIHNKGASDSKLWCDPRPEFQPPHTSRCVPNKWTHSLRGDWSTKYWDKTANQAYHFWFYVAVTFFDSQGMAIAANEFHDQSGQVVTYDFSGSDPTIAPPPNVSTQPDRDLAYQGITLGLKLRSDADMQNMFGCGAFLIFSSTDMGSWIRSHLKG